MARIRSLAALLFALPLTALVTACASGPPPVPDAIQREVRAMAAEDQRWEQLVIARAPEVREPGFHDRKDELQDRHAERCREIFEEHGLLSPGRVGDAVASDDWVLVQHADRDPEFQAEVLAAMDGLPEACVDPAERAYLVDRVRVNTDRPQVYGTQVAYDLATGRAFPEPLEEPAGVDERRAAVGLEPLWQYMNGMCELQFGMNQDVRASVRHEPEGARRDGRRRAVPLPGRLVGLVRSPAGVIGRAASGAEPALRR